MSNFFTLASKSAFTRTDHDNLSSSWTNLIMPPKIILKVFILPPIYILRSSSCKASLSNTSRSTTLVISSTLLLLISGVSADARELLKVSLCIRLDPHRSSLIRIGWPESFGISSTNGTSRLRCPMLPWMISWESRCRRFSQVNMRKNMFIILLFFPSTKETGRSISPHSRVDESLNAMRLLPSHGFRSCLRNPYFLKIMRYIRLHKLPSSMRILDTEWLIKVAVTTNGSISLGVSSIFLWFWILNISLSLCHFPICILLYGRGPCYATSSQSNLRKRLEVVRKLEGLKVLCEAGSKVVFFVLVWLLHQLTRHI